MSEAPAATDPSSNPIAPQQNDGIVEMGQEQISMMSEFVMNYGERAVLAALVLASFIFVGFLLSIIIKRLGKNKSIRGNRAYRLIAGSLNSALITIGVISSLGTLGVNITALVAGLGLTGFALGLALKDAISNFVAGLLVIVYSPFDLDDRIEVNGIKGSVHDMDLRYVTVRTDEQLILIPNNTFLTCTIKRSLPREMEVAQTEEQESSKENA